MTKRRVTISILILFGVFQQGCLIGHCGFEDELHMIMIVPVIIFFCWILLSSGNMNFGGGFISGSSYYSSSKTVKKKPKGESRPRLSGGDKYGRTEE